MRDADVIDAAATMPPIILMMRFRQRTHDNAEGLAKGARKYANAARYSIIRALTPLPFENDAEGREAGTIEMIPGTI